MVTTIPPKSPPNKENNNMTSRYGFDTHYDQDDTDALRELLVGHTVTKVDGNTLQLDDGTRLHIEGNDGGCACSAGCYDLTELNDCPINMITAVEFDNDPADDWGGGEGYYRIFVLAHDERIKLAEFEGSDGNGCYGTGYWIGVTRQKEQT